MDALRFGPADAPDTGRVLPGVVGGISFYGNCLGLPNIGGELDFDPSYAGNPLVNALCVGVMRHDDLQVAAASARGYKGDAVRFHDRPGRCGPTGLRAGAPFFRRPPCRGHLIWCVCHTMMSDRQGERARHLEGASRPPSQ
jgi:phosphoribosylformylglycinamidine synthase